MVSRASLSAIGWGFLGLTLGGAAQGAEAYGYGPGPGLTYPEMGYPGPFGYGPGLSPPEMGSSTGPYGYGPPSWDNAGPYGYSPGMRAGPREGLRIIRDADANAYYILISTGDVAPQAVQVRIEGRWLLVGIDRSRQDSVQQSFDEGRGYQRSFSYSTGQTNRRLTVPQDADTAGMRREDGDREVRITLPRRNP